MSDLWQLPKSLPLGGVQYPIHADFRDILQIIHWLEKPDATPETRLYVALRLFWPGFEALPLAQRGQAAPAMLEFIAGGSPEQEPAGPKLFDWQQDADLIIADVNRVAGCEIRALPFVHWWTFLAWFSAIGEGRLSAVVAIRQKLNTGRQLEDWERSYYLANRQRIRLNTAPTKAQAAEKRRLEALLRGKKEE